MGRHCITRWGAGRTRNGERSFPHLLLLLLDAPSHAVRYNTLCYTLFLDELTYDLTGRRHSMSSSYPTSTSPLRVAIIGYGLAGSVFHAPLVRSTPGMSVAAIVTGNPERQQRAVHDYPEAAIISNTEELWRDPSHYDLVVVAAPNLSHVPLG